MQTDWELEDWLLDAGDRAERAWLEGGDAALSPVERLVREVWLLDMETRNGGLSQDFANHELARWTALRAAWRACGIPRCSARRRTPAGMPARRRPARGAPSRATGRRRGGRGAWPASPRRDPRRLPDAPHPPSAGLCASRCRPHLPPIPAASRSHPSPTRTSVPQALYDRIGIGYAAWRRPDARIAARIAEALCNPRSVVNVGAGAGAYEPAEGRVVAVEPSAEMVRQRPPGAPPAVRASAEALPFGDDAFHAALGVLTIHHWPDWRAGLREMRRVARGRVVLLTFDADHPGFWLVQDYFPGILEMDRRIMPPLSAIGEVLGSVDVRPVPVPADCTDGFLGAYWRRPATYLEAGARGAISAFARLPDVEPGLARLRADLEDGTWQRRHGWLMSREALDIGYRLVVAEGGD